MILYEDSSWLAVAKPPGMPTHAPRPGILGVVEWLRLHLGREVLVVSRLDSGTSGVLLLATMVGFSVIIPYIGAAVATLPIAVIAWFQWGWSADFAWIIVAYGIIQALDGNLLVPLLFSEVVNLHPVAIIIAVLFFGGIWGFWGVFLAIPLATLVQAVLNDAVQHLVNRESLPFGGLSQVAVAPAPGRVRLHLRHELPEPGRIGQAGGLVGVGHAERVAAPHVQHAVPRVVPGSVGIHDPDRCDPVQG